MSSSLSRSTLSHVARRRCRVPSTARACLTPVKALSTMPQTTLGVDLGAKAPPPFAQNQPVTVNVNATNASKKFVEVHLVKTLENIIQVQKTFQSLTSDNATKALSSLIELQKPANIDRTSTSTSKSKSKAKKKDSNKSLGYKHRVGTCTRNHIHKDMGIEPWKEFLVTAFKNRDKKLAQDLINATPDNIKDSVDPLLLRSLGNIIHMLDKEHDRDLAFQIFRRMEDLRPNLKFTGEKGDMQQVRFSVHETRLTAIRRILKFLLHNPRDIPFGPYMGMVRTMRLTIQNLPESDPNLNMNLHNDGSKDKPNNHKHQHAEEQHENLHEVDEAQLKCAINQHEFYPKLLKSLMRYGNTNNVRKSAAWKAMERDVWDEALYHFRGNFQRDILADGNRNGIRNKHGHYVGTKGGFVLASYEKILKMGTYRNQKFLPFPYMLRLVIMAGGRPSPDIVCNIIQNEYPFTNNNNVREIAKMLRKLQWVNANQNPHAPDYVLDMGTLEHMTSIPCRKGFTQVAMLLTQYMEMLTATPTSTSPNALPENSTRNYTPSIGLYENFAKSFASNRSKRMEILFQILADMEDLEGGKAMGYTFCRQVGESLRTRSTVMRLSKAVHILQNGHAAQQQISQFTHHSHSNYNEDEDDMYSQRGYTYGYQHNYAYDHHNNNNASVEDVPVRPTTTALNCILSAYADLGLTEEACEVFTKFAAMDLTPNEDSFAFLMKAIAMNLMTALPAQNVMGGIVYGQEDGSDDGSGHGHEWVSRQVQAAEVLLQEGLGRDVSNKNFNHWYVQVLSAAGLVDKAVKYVTDVVHKSDSESGNDNDNENYNENDSGDDEALNVPPLKLKSLALIALELAKVGDFEGVEGMIDLANAVGYKKGLPPHVHERIERLKGVR